MQVISASALNPHCGMARVLRMARTPNESQARAMKRGDAIHAILAEMAHGVDPGEGSGNARTALALFEIAGVPHRPGVFVEMPVGLTVTGRYVAVEETEPHVYAAIEPGQLLTAGRLDVAWVEMRGDLSVAVVRDYKTGRHATTPAIDNVQVGALGLAFADRCGADAIDIGLAYTWGLDSTGTIPLDSPEAARIWDRVSTAARMDETPRPGPWCEDCWEIRECPATK